MYHRRRQRPRSRAVRLPPVVAPFSPPFLTTLADAPAADPSLPGSGDTSPAGSAAHKLAAIGSASTELPRCQPWPNRPPPPPRQVAPPVTTHLRKISYYRLNQSTLAIKR
jgi:hypothetical protein